MSIQVNPNSKPNAFLHEFVSDPINYLLTKRNSSGDFVFVAVVDSAIGQNYPFGFDPDNPNYAGCLVDWSKVFSLYGYGVYRIAVNYSDENSLVSYCFNLQQYEDGYFTISTQTNGEHRNVIYNKAQTISFKRFYDTNDWQDGSTYYGKIFRADKTVEKSTITDSNFNRRTPYSLVDQEYTLRIYEVEYELYLRLKHYGLRGDDIIITDFNSDQVFTFVDIDIQGASESSFEKLVNNQVLHTVDIKVRAKRKAIYGN